MVGASLYFLSTSLQYFLGERKEMGLLLLSVLKVLVEELTVKNVAIYAEMWLVEAGPFLS